MVECFCSMSLFSLAASTTSWSNCNRQSKWTVEWPDGSPGIQQVFIKTLTFLSGSESHILQCDASPEELIATGLPLNATRCRRVA
ncbi:hypothetical protein EYF80_005712 [Liparis tanakae]|uniref:Secreted protein n=1 Tax=Liparis tanakae TaxID=230148 RepID=A0A4Z2J1Q0_9TELE|nr:hypothetical protein EYF80_005712 [Liparis tanakae]